MTSLTHLQSIVVRLTAAINNYESNCLYFVHDLKIIFHQSLKLTAWAATVLSLSNPSLHADTTYSKSSMSLPHKLKQHVNVENLYTEHLNELH